MVTGQSTTLLVVRVDLDRQVLIGVDELDEERELVARSDRVAQELNRPILDQLTQGCPGKRPIVLAPVNDLLGLVVTEGIEDGLTAYEATGLGVWVAGSAGRMRGLVDLVPPFIEVVTVCAHADKAGEDGARKLATALCKRGIEVRMEGL